MKRGWIVTKEPFGGEKMFITLIVAYTHVKTDQIVHVKYTWIIILQ